MNPIEQAQFNPESAAGLPAGQFWLPDLRSEASASCSFTGM